jgi:hypothetical protein
MVNKDNEIIYIGKTINIDQRLRQHMMDKNKKWFKTVYKIYYAECSNKTDMDIYEIYYINKLMPLHNKQLVNNIEFSKILDELNFVEYKKKIKPRLKNKNIKLKNETKSCYNINSYEVGENFIENENILQYYKTNSILSKDWEYLLEGKQFLRGSSHPCTFDHIEINNGLYFNPFDKMGIYRMSFDYFIKEISSGKMSPLKYLSQDAVNNINQGLEYQMSKNKIEVINMLEKCNIKENERIGIEEFLISDKVKHEHRINNVVVEVF